MVVAQIVRIRNNTLHVFSVRSGDYFYTPQVDGRPCVDGVIEVSPGFDQTTEGLVIPWERLSGNGLEISDEDTQELMRCIVGPIELDNDDRDWLQFRSRDWQKVGQQNWTPLGRRHILGAIGGSVQMQLTFRDPRSNAAEPAALMDVIHFDRAVTCAAPNTVFLNVFDLASPLSIPNAMLCNTVYSTIGAFHAAVETYGEEWSFYRTPNPLSCGVCKSLRPRHHPVHVYRQSVSLGATTLKEWEVRYLIRGQLATKWPGGSYDLLHRNCIHFCEELQLCLGVKPVPSWVKGLHETGARVLQIPWPVSIFFGGDEIQGSNKYAIEDGESFRSADNGSEVPSCSGTGTSTGIGTGTGSGTGTGTADVALVMNRCSKAHSPPVDGTFVEPEQQTERS